ncbi:hypothetical protein BT69DRAFT_571766 [Atractiella rhizophila]|nr:hypothetical protein BT69DRAFT_571766 [Atractiella rhizophila]
MSTSSLLKSLTSPSTIDADLADQFQRLLCISQPTAPIAAPSSNTADKIGSGRKGDDKTLTGAKEKVGRVKVSDRIKGKNGEASNAPSRKKMQSTATGTGQRSKKTGLPLPPATPPEPVPVEPALSPAQVENLAKSAVNACLQTLNSIRESGWKYPSLASPPPPQPMVTASSRISKTSATSRTGKSSAASKNGLSRPASVLENVKEAKEKEGQVNVEKVKALVDVALIGLGRLGELAREKGSDGREKVLEVENVRSMIMACLFNLQAMSVLPPLLTQRRHSLLTLYFHLSPSISQKSLTPPHLLEQTFPLPHPIDQFFTDATNSVLIHHILFTLSYSVLSVPISDISLRQPNGYLVWLQNAFDSPGSCLTEEARTKMEKLARMVFSKLLREVEGAGWDCFDIRLAGFEAVLACLEKGERGWEDLCSVE